MQGVNQSGEEEVKTGTTTVAIEFDGGAVLATERRASMGYQVSGKNTKKVYEIDGGIGITTAGSVGDVQTVVRYMKAETNLFKYKKDRKMTPKAVASLMSNILQGSKALPYMGLFILGGYDHEKETAEVFQLDPAGGVLQEDKYYATGSGSQVAYGLLEDGFEEDLSRDEAVSLALRSISSASERDIASGNGFSVMVIDAEGCHILEDEEVESYISE
ncbi:MAG: proteasome subunit beta [Candidatus Aenigmatarchaeota archaeon]